MGCSAVFIPFKNFFFGYITKFNSQESFDYYTCFFGETKKVFINREWLENFEPIEFAGGVQMYCSKLCSAISGKSLWQLERASESGAA